MIPIASRDLMAAIARHHADLAELYRQLAADREDRGDHADDRVLGLAEAAARLGVSRSWLSRRANWSRVGGYLGPDRRVKFRGEGLRSHLESVSNHS